MTAGVAPESFSQLAAALFSSANNVRRMSSAGVIALRAFLPGCGGDVTRKVVGDETAAAMAQHELPAEISPSFVFIRLLDQPTFCRGEIGKQQRKGGEHGARLEVEVLDGLLLRRIEVVDMGELGDHRAIDERHAGRQIAARPDRTGTAHPPACSKFAGEVLAAARLLTKRVAVALTW